MKARVPEWFIELMRAETDSAWAAHKSVEPPESLYFRGRIDAVMRLIHLADHLIGNNKPRKKTK